MIFVIDPRCFSNSISHEQILLVVKGPVKLLAKMWKNLFFAHFRDKAGNFM